MRWEEHISLVRMSEIRKAEGSLAGKPEGKKLLVTSKCI
jgi:hypothetical protein